jgi:hypothetical protein
VCIMQDASACSLLSEAWHAFRPFHILIGSFLGTAAPEIW